MRFFIGELRAKKVVDIKKYLQFLFDFLQLGKKYPSAHLEGENYLNKII